jgi:hypothetical protein
MEQPFQLFSPYWSTKFCSCSFRSAVMFRCAV